MHYLIRISRQLLFWKVGRNQFSVIGLFIGLVSFRKLFIDFLDTIWISVVFNMSWRYHLVIVFNILWLNMSAFFYNLLYNLLISYHQIVTTIFLWPSSNWPVCFWFTNLFFQFILQWLFNYYWSLIIVCNYISINAILFLNSFWIYCLSWLRLHIIWRNDLYGWSLFITWLCLICFHLLLRG